MGFITPEDKWIRTHQKEFRDIILTNVPPFIDKMKLEKWLSLHLDSVSIHDNRLWKLLCFQRWAQIFNVKYS